LLMYVAYWFLVPALHDEHRTETACLKNKTTKNLSF